MDPYKVLIIDDDPMVVTTTTRLLVREGYQVEAAVDTVTTAARVETGVSPWDVVLLDISMPGLGGFELLEKFRESGSLSAVIMLSGDGTAMTAASCMRRGAYDYLTKPYDNARLLEVVEAAARYSQMRRAALAEGTGTDNDAGDTTIVGLSTAMRQLRSTIYKVAKQNASVLIQGESGSGKELVARLVHESSARASAPFIPVNCSAFAEGLIDSELFGHQKGAFTGAVASHGGLFVEADKGTLFLDEIAEMALGVQARLLRVLQTGELRPVGGTGTREVDVRVIAATHVDLSEAVEKGAFRQDLYYRLNVVALSIPPLRDRPEDIPLLAATFLRKHGGDAQPMLSAAALDALMSYAWPGNVRELENAIQAAIALRNGDEIGPEALPESIRLRSKSSTRIIPMTGGAEGSDPGVDLSLADAKRRVTTEFEKSYLMRVMTETNGSVNKAARLAGMDRTNFRRLLQRHGIDPDDYR